jgi:hypothetical protein
VVIQPDGRVVMAAWGDNGTNIDQKVLRWTSSGVLDTTWGTGGVLTQTFTVSEYAFDVVLSPEGDITSFGYASGGTSIAAAQYDGVSVSDYVNGVTDWDTAGTNMFGACLRSVAGGAGTDGTTWSTTGACTGVDTDPWRAIVPTSGDPASKVAHVLGIGTTTASVNLRFAFRTLASQPPGSYVAPITFTVIAPNA